MGRKKTAEPKVRAARFRVDYEVMKAALLLPDGAAVGSAREAHQLGVRPVVEVVVSHPDFPEVGANEDYPLGDILMRSDGSVPEFVCFVLGDKRYAEGEPSSGRRARAAQLLDGLRRDIDDELNGRTDVTGWGRMRRALDAVDELIKLTR